MKQNETYKFNKVCYQYFMDSNNDFSKMNIYANNINLSIQKFLIYVHNYIEENIVLTDYPENISLKELKKQELSFIKRILIGLKEGFEMMKEYDINFYNLYYNEKQNTKNK